MAIDPRAEAKLNAMRDDPYTREAENHVKHGFKELQSSHGKKKSLTLRKNKTLVFWSNDWGLNKDDDPYSRNRQEAEDYCTRKNVGTYQRNKFYTLENTKLGQHFDKRWLDPNIPPEAKIPMAIIYSRGFAECAGNEVAVFVNHTSLPSFFRSVELPLIMENKKVQIIHYKKPGDARMSSASKREWYQWQLDQWLDATIERLEVASKNGKMYEYEYQDAAKWFLLEFAEIDKRLRDFGNHQWLTGVHAEDYAREAARMEKCISARNEHHAILNKFSRDDTVRTALQAMLELRKIERHLSDLSSATGGKATVEAVLEKYMERVAVPEKGIGRG